MNKQREYDIFRLLYTAYTGNKDALQIAPYLNSIVEDFGLMNAIKSMIQAGEAGYSSWQKIQLFARATPEWRTRLDDRQEVEVDFAETYASEFNHGTDGHHRLILISQMAKMLNEAYRNEVEVPATAPEER